MRVGDISHSCRYPCASATLIVYLFGGVFCIFSTDLNSASNFAYYDTHKEFLKTFFFCLALFADFKAKIGRNGSKKENEILII
jgi:hypothetical protein